MKFRSPRFKRLRIVGVGQFVDGVLEVDDEAAIKRVQAVAERYGVHAVLDRDGPFDPSEHDRDTVNAYLDTASEAERTRVLELEASGKGRTTILNGPHGAPSTEG